MNPHAESRLNDDDGRFLDILRSSATVSAINSPREIPLPTEQHLSSLYTLHGDLALAVRRLSRRVCR